VEPRKTKGHDHIGDDDDVNDNDDDVDDDDEGSH